MISPDTRRFKVNKNPSQRSLKFSIEPGVEMVDRLDNKVVLKWKLTQNDKSDYGRTKRFFEISFNKKYRDRVLDGYLEFVMRKAEDIVNNTEKVVKIHGNPIDEDQGSLTLNHLITFEKLAMDPDLRQAIKDDLDRFKTGQEFYRKMQAVRRTRTTEDSYPKLTLSGLLNFIDGLWSNCGDERIIVVTTNHKDRLDPALLRPGRIDMEIHMSYCTGQGFRILASRYLNIDEDHMLFGEIEDLIANVEVTPAEIAGQLIRSEDADIALAGVVDFLRRQMEANEAEVGEP
ncbi:hypothetical protein Vadar_021376 [Vaccinium darrowii]|uniref:Uncharacterized protein n=1 Tax=Vaccinium darrowii TaxID=229202 RepID=A0ACB7YXI5_9ERIC|nr:hypothetical protein Vadar_021376 [Vaccinium darrowii]